MNHEQQKKLVVAGVLAGVLLLLVLAGHAVLSPFLGGSISAGPSPFMPRVRRVQTPLTLEQRDAIRQEREFRERQRERTHGKTDR
jgi:hypothetical protein